MGGRTLIVVRRTPAEPKTTLAGARLEFCSARFRPSMDAVSEEWAPSRPSDCRGFEDIVETRGGFKEVVRHEGREEKPKPYKYM